MLLSDLKRSAEVDQIDSIPTPPVIEALASSAPSPVDDLTEIKLRRFELELSAAKSKSQYLSECLEQQQQLLVNNRAELAEEREKFKEGMAMKEAELTTLRIRLFELNFGVTRPQ